MQPKPQRPVVACLLPELGEMQQHEPLVVGRPTACGSYPSGHGEDMHRFRGNVRLEVFEGEDDHVHLLVCHPPKVALSRLVNSLKGASLRLIRTEKFPEVTRHLWGEQFWLPSCCMVSCGGAPLEIIKKHAEQQREICRAAAGARSEEQRQVRKRFDPGPKDGGSR